MAACSLKHATQCRFKNEAKMANYSGQIILATQLRSILVYIIAWPVVVFGIMLRVIFQSFPNYGMCNILKYYKTALSPNTTYRSCYYLFVIESWEIFVIESWEIFAQLDLYFITVRKTNVVVCIRSNLFMSKYSATSYFCLLLCWRTFVFPLRTLLESCHHFFGSKHIKISSILSW